MNPDFNCLSIGYSQFIRRSLQSSWYKQVPTHCLSLFATSAEDLPDSVIFSFTMNYTKTTWFLQSTFINILHINPRVFHGSSRRTPCGRTPLTESGLAAFPHPALCETNRSHLSIIYTDIFGVLPMDSCYLSYSEILPSCSFSFDSSDLDSRINFSLRGIEMLLFFLYCLWFHSNGNNQSVSDWV